MKAFVITLLNNNQSVKAANKCIASAKKVGGIRVEKMAACDASKVDVHEIFKANGIGPSSNFVDVWSRQDKAMACFFSHYSAWAIAEASNKPILILEHDAVFKKKIDLDALEFNGILNIGKPSYGRFETPHFSGVGAFVSGGQGYLKGAHAYVVSPEAASDLIKLAKTKAGPADLFISLQNFPRMEEYYPWPVVVEETFSTVQKEKGTLAKHAYDKDYKVI